MNNDEQITEGLLTIYRLLSYGGIDVCIFLVEDMNLISVLC